MWRSPLGYIYHQNLLQTDTADFLQVHSKLIISISENGICKLETIKKNRVIYERACNLLFSTNGINCYFVRRPQYSHLNVQLSIRNMTITTYLTDILRARFARAYCVPISCY